MPDASNASPPHPSHPPHLECLLRPSSPSNASPTPLMRTNPLQHVPYTSNASPPPLTPPLCLRNIHHVGLAQPVSRPGSTLDLDEDLLVIEVDGDENLPRIQTQRQETLEARRRFTWPIID
ncbi:hypothetical protein OG21DRAFT_617265 [Imleria badia]|nr:hypothetical protein OG21DRAFT_617265 [Imleria badia]